MPVPSDRADRIAAADANAMAKSWYVGQLLPSMRDIVETATAALGSPTTTTLPVQLSSGSTSALTTTAFVDVPVDFPFIITGWKLLSRDNGAIILSVRRATYDDYPTFTSITGSAPPTLVSRKAVATDSDLTGWTTQINADDILSIGVTSNVGALTAVFLGLRVRRLGSRN